MFTARGRLLIRYAGSRTYVQAAAGSGHNRKAAARYAERHGLQVARV